MASRGGFKIPASLRSALKGAALFVVLWLATWPGLALETDPFYAWDRDLVDATDAINAHVDLTLQQALDRNRRAASSSCEQITHAVGREFRQLIFHPTELWANNSRLVDRAPAAGEEERLHRKTFIYRNLNLHPMGEWMPPSPTISVNGVRIGTDKLAHFFSEGHLYFKKYRKALRRGATADDAARTAIRWGIYSEQRILGKTSSGVFSVSDLEANYRGMEFFRSLCDGPNAYLERRDGQWRLVRPFDFRRYVTPEWDESWQPSVMSRRAWKKVQPEVRRYCELLASPRVVALREEYRIRDETTVTEAVLEQAVREGRVEDPARFSIERVCAEATPTRTSSGTGPHDPPSESLSVVPGGAGSSSHRR